MSKAPEIVVTGLLVRDVHLWACVLVRPERLQDVKHSIVTMGRADLQPGEILQIDTNPGEGIERAVTVGDPGAERPWGPGIVAWNEFRSDVTIYADDVGHIAAISEPVVTALIGRGPFELMSKEVWLHSDRIDSIHVGGVHVYFDRSEDTKEGINPEAPKAKGVSSDNSWAPVTTHRRLGRSGRYGTCVPCSPRPTWISGSIQEWCSSGPTG